ncbi:VOC family protein [bacterium]|nr:VOC family protein [bacterium]
MAIMIHYWTHDVEKIMKYYIEKLAFDLEYRQPSDSAANFCILRMADSKIMFAIAPSSQILPDRKDYLVLQNINKRTGSPGLISVYIGINDINGYFKKIKNNKAEIIEPIWDTPWNLRQFSVLDPDENITTFFSE